MPRTPSRGCARRNSELAAAADSGRDNAVVVKIDTGERRRRLAVRQHLAPGCRSAPVAELAGDLVGVHATDPASVYLGAWARMREFTRSDMERALYEDRSVLKFLGMRRTMFVVPRDL